ncbi:alpha/beta hydrolase [Methylobacterium sp. J-078]|uniref:alpha/beta hydrolase n=1 Tax=Methylobacterium sp. J-078 TaxID=2836657 RepID=UPI001FB982AF|nr:alpha/beta hydrolase [Methylobacterium sp. J-078]MCJ2046479.1 alpha/beta hydrolase [Methylobacterium sp. J-078]
MRLLLSMLVAAPLALFVGATLLLALFQRHLIYPGAFRNQTAPTPREAPAGTQAIRVETADGERLLGFWRPPAPGCAVVLSFHGNGSRPEPAAARFAADPWRAEGWGVLAIAYRGYPGSTGSPSEAGLIADADAAYRTVAARAPGAPVLLHGHSLGAAVAVAVGVSVSHLGLYLEAPFDSLAAVAASRFPYLPTGLFLRDTFRSDERITGTGGPVLIVHGTRDGVVPLAHARHLAERAGPRARLTILDGDHVSILGARDREAEALFRPGNATVSPCRKTLAADAP